MKQVFLADSDMAVRSAMALLLKHKFGVNNICEIADAEQLSDRMARSKPDLLLLDWDLPGLEFSSVIEQFNERGTHPPVIVMSVKPENESGILASGADGFLNKQAPAECALKLLQRHLLS